MPRPGWKGDSGLSLIGLIDPDASELAWRPRWSSLGRPPGTPIWDAHLGGRVESDRY